MKFTNKLKIGKKDANRPEVKLEWLEQAFSNPDSEEVLSDGKIRRYAKVGDGGKKIRLTISRKAKTTS